MKVPGMNWLDSLVSEALDKSVISLATHADKLRFINKINSLKDEYPDLLYQRVKNVHLPYLSSPRELESIFIELYAFKVLKRNRLGQEGSQRVSTDKIFESQRQMLILGEPGAGKTTLLKKIAYSSCSKDFILPFLERKELFPVLVECRGPGLLAAFTEYNKRVNDVKEERRELLKDGRNIEYVKERVPDPVEPIAIWLGIELKKYDFPYPEQLIISLLKNNKLLVLVDGLDEVPIKTRSQLSREVDYLASKYPATHILVTCRVSETINIPKLLSKCEIAPLDDKQKYRFVDKWFNSDKHKDDFLVKSRNTHIWEITDRPLLLSMLCSLYRDGNELPRYKVDIYRECTELALRKWDAYRDIERESMFQDLSTNQKINILASIASKMTLDGLTQVDSISLIGLIENTMEENSIEGSPENLMKEFINHSGLITQISVDGYSFSHKSFQEYFSALYFSQSDPILPAREFKKDIQWKPILEMTSCLVTDATKILTLLSSEIKKSADLDNDTMLEVILELVLENPVTIAVKGRENLIKKAFRLIEDMSFKVGDVVAIDKNRFENYKRIVANSSEFESCEIVEENNVIFLMSKEQSTIPMYERKYTLCLFFIFSLSIGSPKLLKKFIKYEKDDWKKMFLASILVNRTPALSKREYSNIASSEERYLRSIFNVEGK